MLTVLRRTRSRVVTLVVGFSLLVMFMLASIASAVAGPYHSIDTYYYSDASMSKQVGATHLYCSGHFSKSGKITPYSYSFDDPCY